MSGLEVNKILASIILAVLIVTLIGHFGDLVIDIDHDEKKETAFIYSSNFSFGVNLFFKIN